MKCYELKNLLDSYCEDGYEENEIVIMLHESSIGGHAFSVVKNAILGFDWDNGKILLVSENKIVSDRMHRDNKRNKVLWHNKLMCPNCQRYIEEKDHYCRQCGQALSDVIKKVGIEHVVR